MARARLPNVNQRVSIRPEAGGEWIPTVVQDLGGGLIAVASPMVGSEFVPVAPGQRWIVRYFDHSGEYRFTAQVKRVDRAPVALTWLELPLRVEQIQRRNHVRLSIGLPVLLWPEGDGQPDGVPDAGAGVESSEAGVESSGAGPEPGAAAPPEPIQAETLDLSAGGVRLRTEQPLPDARRFVIELPLPDGVLRVSARLVRASESVDAHGVIRRSYGFSFIDIREADQDRIVRFVFAEQRRRRQLGLM